MSNFILVERYAVDRKTKTWDEAVRDKLENLPVEVIQVTSDEGRSLISHALKGLKVHHSPDSFHVIYEIGRGTCGALMSKIRKAEKEHENAIKRPLKIERVKKKNSMPLKTVHEDVDRILKKKLSKRNKKSSRSKKI